MPARRHVDDTHFRAFALNLEQALVKYGEVPEEELVERQKRQVERLVGLETEFRRLLIKHAYGPGVYRAFVRYICEEKRNILAARPFFRERQQIFTQEISKALKARAEKSLFRFHFNTQFVLFALSVYRWRPGSPVVRVAKEIFAARRELVEMNLPLAISRARIFWSRTPQAQLSYMDLVQITAEGLMSGVDKFVLPYTTAFRAVLIGRMLGNLIEQYSETMVHFYPVDKRKIYRANKAVSQSSDSPDFEKVAEVVNKDVEPTHRTTASEIAGLMAAASTVSADAPMGGGDVDDDRPESRLPLDIFQADEDTRPDFRVENREAMSVMTAAIQELSLFERKLLRMRGVSL